MTTTAAGDAAKILGVRRKVRDEFDLIEMGDGVLGRAALLKLAAYLEISPAQLARLLPISERTVQRHGADKPFNRPVSEQLLQIAGVAVRGVEVFEDRARFLAWLKQPSAALGNNAPLALLKSRFGADMVLAELGRMEHGIFA